MRKGTATITEVFENPTSDGDYRIEATFQFDVSKWSESHPYGSTTAREPMAEATCTAIYVAGKGVTEEELQAITGGGFDPENDWDRIEGKALDQI